MFYIGTTKTLFGALCKIVYLPITDALAVITGDSNDIIYHLSHLAPGAGTLQGHLHLSCCDSGLPAAQVLLVHSANILLVYKTVLNHFYICIAYLNNLVCTFIHLYI